MADFARRRQNAVTNSVEQSPNSHKPSPEKLRWFDTVYEDSIYGQPESYSFSDVQATAILPFVPPGGSQKCYLPGLTLISLSEHRDVFPVVGMGRAGIKSFTTGHKTTAGTLGFVLFGTSPFSELIRKYNLWRNAPAALTQFTAVDELPPIDIILSLASDKGDAATIIIKAAKFLDRSQNISVRDIQLTEVYSFMAASCSYLIPEIRVSRPPVERTTLSGTINQAMVRRSRNV